MHRLVVLAAMLGCSESSSGATVASDLEPEPFSALSSPSDLRLTADGPPDLANFPNPRNLPVVNDLLSVAAERRGFSTMPIAWFELTADVAIDARGAYLIDLEDGTQ